MVGSGRVSETSATQNLKSIAGNLIALVHQQGQGKGLSAVLRMSRGAKANAQDDRDPYLSG